MPFRNNPNSAARRLLPGDVETIPATFLRINARDLMARVKYRGERFLVETFGHPMAVIISYEDYLCIRHYLPPPAVQIGEIPELGSGDEKEDGSTGVLG